MYETNKKSQNTLSKKQQNLREKDKATRTTKYIVINLTMEVKDLYSENQRKKLMKTQINGSIYCFHALEELISLKCPYY